MHCAGNLKAQSHWGCMRRCTLSQATVTAGKGRDLRPGALPQELRCFQWFPGWQCWPELVGGALPVTSPLFSLFLYCRGPSWVAVVSWALASGWLPHRETLPPYHPHSHPCRLPICSSSLVPSSWPSASWAALGPSRRTSAYCSL